jgi:hypothetical protein
VYLIN